MSMSVAGKNVALDAWGVQADFASLHNGYPGLTGANEISGGTPAYARLGATWNAAAAGAIGNLAQPDFAVPAGEEIRFIGFWSALTGGTFYGYMVVGDTAAVKEMIADVTGNTIEATGHGFADTNKIVFVDGAAPGGLTEGNVYFVRDATADTFAVAATSGGAAIDLTTAGALACKVSLIVSETFGAQGNFNMDTATMNLNL